MFVGTKDERQQASAHHYHGESARSDQAIVLPPSPQFKLKEFVDAEAEMMSEVAVRIHAIMVRS